MFQKSFPLLLLILTILTAKDTFVELPITIPSPELLKQKHLLQELVLRSIKENILVKSNNSSV